MNDLILSCSNLTKRFASKRGTLAVLTDINLSVRRGEMVVIRGRSGAGKSTLLQLLAGLDAPTSGRVEIAGRPLDELPNAELLDLRRRAMGFIFQHFNLIPSWTARENVEAALIHSALPRRERAQRARDLLERLELGDRVEHLPSELSVGQQQRVAIARALVHRPALVFADEPTGDVDPGTAAAIMECLVHLVRENQTTFLVCTHGEFAGETVDQDYGLCDGELEPAVSPGSE